METEKSKNPPPSTEKAQALAKESMQAPVPKDFRHALSLAFIKKVGINKNYSLRAYARFLGVHYATLSHLLSGKREITKKTILRLAPRLGIADKELQSYLTKIDSTLLPLESTSGFHSHSEEATKALQEWYHDAILELLKIKDFSPDISWIANKLEISLPEARAAIERLQFLGLIQTDHQGRWFNSYENNTTQTTELNTSAALRKYQKDLLEKSMAALELLPIEQRTHTSIMVALNSQELDQFREIIKRFRREVNEFATRKESTPDQVYVFTIGGFPLSKK